MKALFNSIENYFSIYLEKGNLEKLLSGRDLACGLYKTTNEKNTTVGYLRNRFQVIPLKKKEDVFKKALEMGIRCTDILVVKANEVLKTPYILYVSKEWMQQALTKDLLIKNGRIEEEYDSRHNYKVYFYLEGCADSSTNDLSTQMKEVFAVLESEWKRNYAHHKD